MRENTQTTAASQLIAAPVDTASDKAGTQAASSRARYSGNDIMRLMNALKSAKLDMDDKRFSMNGVVHLVLEEIESLMQSHNCSYADIARLFSSNGCPVSERTLKDYLARARKDAREGRTGYSRTRQLIIESAGAEPAESAGASDASESEPAEPFETAGPVIADAGKADHASTAEVGIPDVSSCPAGQEESRSDQEFPDFDDMAGPDCGFLERSVSEAMESTDAANSRRQNIQHVRNIQHVQNIQHIQAVCDARKRRKKARLAKKKGEAA